MKGTAVWLPHINQMQSDMPSMSGLSVEFKHPHCLKICTSNNIAENLTNIINYCKSGVVGNNLF